MPAAVERVRDRNFRPRRGAAETHIDMLETFSPPSVLVDEKWNVEHLSESAGASCSRAAARPHRP